MSDIIDINVTPTLEQVEITVTENLTTVNVNTIFGVDAYTKVESNTIFAPINNPTFTGNVVVPDATSDNEAVNLGQLNDAIAETLNRFEDAADYGFLSTNTPSDNVTALNNALIGGNKSYPHFRNATKNASKNEVLQCRCSRVHS